MAPSTTVYGQIYCHAGEKEDRMKTVRVIQPSLSINIQVMVSISLYRRVEHSIFLFSWEEINWIYTEGNAFSVTDIQSISNTMW